MDLLTLQKLYNTLSGIEVHGENNLTAMLGCLQVVREAVGKEAENAHAGNHTADP